MKRKRSILAFGLFIGMIGFTREITMNSFIIFSLWISFLGIIYVIFSIRIADSWERAVVLRLGRLHLLKGPGMFFIIPLVDRIDWWMDVRSQLISFKLDKILTKELKTVDVKVNLLWKVIDGKKAAFEMKNGESELNLVVRKATERVVNEIPFSMVLQKRQYINTHVAKILETLCPNWGVQFDSLDVCLGDT